MNVNISSYIESVLNPNGRVKTLKELYLSRDADGALCVSVSSEWVNFRVVMEGEPYLMKCYRGDRQMQQTKVREHIVYASLLKSRYLSDVVFLEQELLLFDSFERVHYADVILQKEPKGELLRDVAERDLLNNKKREVREVIKGLGAMARWLMENNFSHNRLFCDNIMISPKLELTLMDYSEVSRKHPVDDLCRVGLMLVILYVSCCQRGFYQKYGARVINSRKTVIQTKRRVNELLKGVILPVNLINLLVEINLASEQDADCEDYNLESLCQAIELLSISEFEKLPELNAIVGGNDQHNPTLSVSDSDSASDPLSIRDKLKKFKFVGELNDMTIRVWDGELWGYVDRCGDEIISSKYLSATDFDEGLAVVELESGFGAINREGDYVVEPKFDDVEWNSAANLLFTTLEGGTGLLSREGEIITEMIYTRVLDVSEGLIAAKLDNNYGFINRKGETVIPFIYDDAYGFSNGVARVTIADRHFLIDSKGHEVSLF